MKLDDGIRTKNGVVCSLREDNKDSYILIFDDVINKKNETSGCWEHEVVYTWKEIQEKDIENLTESELAEIGSNLLNRLLVLNKNQKK